VEKRTQTRTEHERQSASTSRSSAGSVRVLAVDDNQSFREALQQLIAAAPGFALVGLACSGEEGLDECARISPQLVLMDVVMPGIGGIAAAGAIVRSDPNVAIVLLSADDPAGYLDGQEFGDGVTSLRKQDLNPRELQRIWTRLSS
jgi:CheY-like chemotaxis protein